MDENVEQARPGGDCGLGILRESLFGCFVREEEGSLPLPLRVGESGEWGTRGRACACVVSCRGHDGVIIRMQKQKRFGWFRSVGQFGKVEMVEMHSKW